MKTIVSLLAALALSLTTLLATAEKCPTIKSSDGDPGARSRNNALYSEASTAYEQKDYAKARDKARAADRALKCVPLVVLLLGRALVGTGEPKLAIVELERISTTTYTEQPYRDAAKAAAEERERLRPKVNVTVKPALDTVVVHIGTAVVKPGLHVLDAGAYEIRAEAPGFEAAKKSVTLEPNTEPPLAMAFELKELAAGAPSQPDAPILEADQQTFAAAVAAFDKGDWDEARVAFKALRRLQLAETTFNLALVYERLGRPTQAKVLFDEVATAPGAPEELKVRAAWHLADLDGKIARRALIVPNGVDEILIDDQPLHEVSKVGAQLTVAGKIEDASPPNRLRPTTSLLIDPGKHVIVVKKDKHHDAVHNVDLAAGSGAAINLATGAPIVIEPPGPEYEKVKQVPTGAWVAGMGGGLAFGTGVVAAVLAKLDYDNAVQACKPYCSDDGRDLVRSGTTKGNVANVAFAAGSALVLTAVVWGFTFPDEIQRPKKATTRRARSIGYAR